MKNVRITKAIADYTGGGIWLFYGNLADGTFFLADGDMLAVRIINADPAKHYDECYYADWQEKHLVRDLDTETEGPAFILKVIQWLKTHKKDFIDSDIIETECKKLTNKRGLQYFTRTYKSTCNSIKGTINLRYNGAYYENEFLRIFIFKTFGNDEECSETEKRISKEYKWCIVKHVKFNREYKTPIEFYMYKGFNKFNDAIDYLLIYQDELKTYRNDTFLPKACVIEGGI